MVSKTFSPSFFLLLLVTCVVGRWPLHMRRGGLPPPYLEADVPLPEAKWFDQKLDHFGNPGTWKQRYFVNSTWWDNHMNDGPVFFLLGGEGPANPAWIVADTSIMLMAQQYGALVFSIEHRFYGESQPTVNVSNEDLEYLSSRQALADFSYFHHEMQAQYNLTKDNKWVSFGGSYSGALSAWLRQEYPDVVVGAVATSAPVLAKLNYVEYVEVVEQSLLTTGTGCAANVAVAAAYVSDMLEDEEHWVGLEKLFNVAPPLANKMDAIQFMSNLAGNFEGVVQYNKDNTQFEGRSNNITITDLCAIMNNAVLGVPLIRYATVNKLMSGKDSLDCSYDEGIKGLSQTSWDAPDVAGGARQWTYQTCTEFGYFQTTDSVNSELFSTGIPLSYFTDMCFQLFGTSESDVSKAVQTTNSYYGGRNVTGTNIVFPNGSIDPWHALSITTQQEGSSVKALFINGTAHCANMYPPRASDPQELKEARMDIAALVGVWLMTA